MSLDKDVDVEWAAGCAVQGLLMEQRHHNRRYKREAFLTRLVDR